jgi:hypothetical protein
MIRLAAFLVATVLLIGATGPDQARAAFGFVPGSPSFDVYDSSGNPYYLAGGHPDKLVVDLRLNMRGDELDGNVKDVYLEFPPGFAGNPNAVPACPRSDLEGSLFGEAPGCDPATQVGVAKMALNGLGVEIEQPIYNVEPAPGQLAVQGAAPLGKMTMLMRLRPDDLGLTIEQTDLTQAIAFKGGTVELWGVPADHQEGTPATRRPLFTMPTRCDQGPLSVFVRANSWQDPEHWVTASGSTGIPLTGCDELEFQPAFGFELTTGAADSPSGARLEVTMPDREGPDDRAPAPARAIEVELPEGLAISPGAVAGMAVCADRELGLDTDQPAACPPASKVGAFELDVPQLDTPLEGGIYLGEERPGERFRLFLVAEGRGLAMKFVAHLRTDPDSGRIGVALEDLPALTFRRMRMEFAGGRSALLATPLGCGRFTTTARFERYGHFPAVDSASASDITEAAGGGACAQSPPFSPRFEGGTTRALAAGRAGLTLTLARASGEQLLERFSVTLPPGLSARFDSVHVCSTSAAAECPAASKVGSATVAVGSGDAAASLAGDVYLTGPWRHAPFGLALVFPAKIGRFDLGTIAVRAALRVDPESGRLTVQSDALPQAIEGMPIRFRSVGLDVDRPDFIRTPTSCAPAAVEADLTSVAGERKTVSSPFRLRGCDSLGFSPRVSVGLTGRKQLRRGGNPGVRIGIRGRAGQANLRGLDIALPESLRRDLGGLRSICSRPDARLGRCSAGSRVGKAWGSTPLFGGRPTGTVNLVRPAGDGPPELWAILRAEGVHLAVRGSVRFRDGRLHARFTDLPDVPLSRLVMQLSGGKRGLLSLGSDPCRPGARRWVMRADLEGWNRAYRILRRRVSLSGCPGSDGDGSRQGASRLG